MNIYTNTFFDKIFSKIHSKTHQIAPFKKNWGSKPQNPLANAAYANTPTFLKLSSTPPPPPPKRNLRYATGSTGKVHAWGFLFIHEM